MLRQEVDVVTQFGVKILLHLLPPEQETENRAEPVGHDVLLCRATMRAIAPKAATSFVFPQPTAAFLGRSAS
jgi:hypothetical protein